MNKTAPPESKELQKALDLAIATTWDNINGATVNINQEAWIDLVASVHRALAASPSQSPAEPGIDVERMTKAYRRASRSINGTGYSHSAESIVVEMLTIYASEPTGEDG